GGVSRSPPGPARRLRIRGDVPHERGHGAHDHAAPARRGGKGAPLPAQASRARRARAEEGARFVPQSLGGNAVTPQAGGEDLKWTIATFSARPRAAPKS